VFVRPRRSATIRTRLDAETVRERLVELAATPLPVTPWRNTSLEINLVYVPATVKR
jgi:hypothetical protein